MWTKVLEFVVAKVLLPFLYDWLRREAKIITDNAAEKAAAEKTHTEITEGYAAVQAAPTMQEKLHAFEKMLAVRRKRLGIGS